MMNAKALLSAAALIAAMGFSVPAMAQDHMIGGKAVPADQVEAVQAACDTLRASGSATTPSAAAAGDTTTGGTAKEASPAPAGDLVIDLETLSIEQCDEGGFVASNP